MLELKNTNISQDSNVSEANENQSHLSDIEPTNNTEYGDSNHINGSEDMVNDESHSRSRSRSQTQVIEIPENFFNEIVDVQQFLNTTTEMANVINLSSLASQDVPQRPEIQDFSECEKKFDCGPTKEAYKAWYTVSIQTLRICR